METASATTGPAQDRRVRRSRSALMRAAIALVSERGTAAVPISEIAEAADVSRQVLYQHFGDRDTLLLEAALDLASRELLPRLADASDSPIDRAPALAMARHFANHREFYRAILTSSSAFALSRALSGLLIPVNRRLVQQMYGEASDAAMVDDLATFLTGGGAAFFNTWVVEGADPLDPEEFTDRLMRMVSVIAAGTRHPLPMTPGKEQAR